MTKINYTYLDLVYLVRVKTKFCWELLGMTFVFFQNGRQWFGYEAIFWRDIQFMLIMPFYRVWIQAKSGESSFSYWL